MYSTISSKKIITISVFIIILLIFILILVTSKIFDQSTGDIPEEFNAKKVFSQLNSTDSIDDFLEIEKMIGDVMKKYGTKAGFELIDEGERQGIISNDACHGLLHYVGHAAFEENPNDFDALLSIVEGTNCLGGYLHGIEAEIVLVSPNVVDDIEKFCVFQKERGVNPGPCYHGVGHAAVELFKYDIFKALQLCDALHAGPETDLSNCYRGIFSEVGNLVTGYDGHTGLTIDVTPIDNFNADKPYTYCETFKEKYQSSCKSQLIKVLVKDLPIERWSEACMDTTFSKQSRQICVNITAGVFVRNQLSFLNEITLPKNYNLFDEETQKIAVLGSAEAFSGYFSDGLEKNWETLCSSFEKENIKIYCVKTFTDMVKNDQTPWMERTDIR